MRPAFPTYPDIVDRLRERIFVPRDDDDPAILDQLDNFIANFRAWRWEVERHRGFGQTSIGDEDELVARARENMFAAFDALERG